MKNVQRNLRLVLCKLTFSLLRFFSASDHHGYQLMQLCLNFGYFEK